MPHAASATSHAERLGDRLADRALRRLTIERELPAEKKTRVEIAEHEIGIGDRGRDPAAPVTGGTWIGSGAVRPDGESREPVDPRDASASGTDLDHLDDRHFYRQSAAFLEPIAAIDLELESDERLAVIDDARFRRRAAHVEGQEARGVHLRTVTRGREGAGRGVRTQRGGREIASRSKRRTPRRLTA